MNIIAPPHNKNSQFASTLRGALNVLNYSVLISGLTDNPTHGPTAQVGVELTASVASWPGAAPTSVAWQWYDGSGEISGATSASYTPVAGDDLEAIYPRATPSDTYDPRNGPSYTVRRAPPEADGTMANRSLVLGSAQTTFIGDLNGRFVGDDLSFSVAGHSTVFVDGTALRCLPDSEADGATITVTATNSGGSAVQQFELDITELVFETATLTGTGKVGATHTAAATVNYASAAFNYDYERDGVSIGATDQDTYVAAGADDETALGVEISATVDGVTISTNTATIDITRVAPTVSAAPVISGSPTTGGNLTGTSATFTGDDLDEGDEWEVSDDGSTGWTGTGDTDTTSPALVEGKYYRLVSTASNSGGEVSSASNVIGPAVAAPTVATITLEDPEDQSSGGDIAMEYAIDADDSTVEMVLFEATEADPEAADFNGAGEPTYIDLGTVNMVTSGGSIDVTLPDDLEGDYKFAALPTGGGDGDVAVSASVGIITTPPDLTGVSIAGGTGTAAWAFTPDRDSAPVTGYRVSLWPDGTDPSDAQIESGTGSVVTVTGTASDSVEESGLFSSLSDATYQPTIFYQDAVGNKVSETYADIVVTAGAPTGLVDNQGDTYWTGGSIGDSQQLFFAITFAKQTDGVAQVLYETQSRSKIELTSGGNIYVRLENTGGTVVYAETTTETITVADGLTELIVDIDTSVPSISVTIDGVPATIGAIATTDTLEFSRPVNGWLADASGGNIADVHLEELLFSNDGGATYEIDIEAATGAATLNTGANNGDTSLTVNGSGFSDV